MANIYEDTHFTGSDFDATEVSKEYLYSQKQHFFVSAGSKESGFYTSQEDVDRILEKYPEASSECFDTLAEAAA